MAVRVLCAKRVWFARCTYMFIWESFLHFLRVNASASSCLVCVRPPHDLLKLTLFKTVFAICCPFVLWPFAMKRVFDCSVKNTQVMVCCLYVWPRFSCLFWFTELWEYIQLIEKNIPCFYITQSYDFGTLGVVLVAFRGCTDSLRRVPRAFCLDGGKAFGSQGSSDVSGAASLIDWYS